MHVQGICYLIRKFRASHLVSISDEPPSKYFNMNYLTVSINIDFWCLRLWWPNFWEVNLIWTPCRLPHLHCLCNSHAKRSQKPSLAWSCSMLSQRTKKDELEDHMVACSPKLFNHANYVTETQQHSVDLHIRGNQSRQNVLKHAIQRIPSILLLKPLLLCCWLLIGHSGGSTFSTGRGTQHLCEQQTPIVRTS